MSAWALAGIAVGVLVVTGCGLVLVAVTVGRFIAVGMGTRPSPSSAPPEM